MSDTGTRTTVPSQIAAGELSLRYIPRPAPAPSVGTAVRVRPGRSEFAYPPEALVIIDPAGRREPARFPEFALLPCPGPATAVPRPGPDTLIRDCIPSGQVDGWRTFTPGPIISPAEAHQRAVAIEYAQRADRILGVDDISHTYRRELACWPD